VVAVGFNPESESEGSDRTFRLPPGQDQLIQKMAAINKRIIVVVTSGGAVDMNGWIDRVPAVLESWYAGEEAGTALAEILFGDVNPSGRLPVSFERHWEDNPAHDSYYPTPGTSRVEYKEGVFSGYRGYEHEGIKPLFPFGYGLSYSTFHYRNLSIGPAGPGTSETNASGSGVRYEVSWDITNTGSRDGADVGEVYVGESHPLVPRPAKELKGFARIALRAGETERVKVLLDGRAFSYYDARAHQWRADPSEFTIFVGQSVDQIELQGTLTLNPSVAALATAKP
jgi:beta-glucosidase